MTEKKCLTKAELAAQYNISRSTLYRWLKKLSFYEEFPDALTRNLLLPKEIDHIYSKLDAPDSKA